MKRAIFVKITVNLLPFGVDGGCLNQLPLSTLVVSNHTLNTCLQTLLLIILSGTFTLNCLLCLLLLLVNISVVSLRHPRMRYRLRLNVSLTELLLLLLLRGVSIGLLAHSAFLLTHNSVPRLRSLILELVRYEHTFKGVDLLEVDQLTSTQHVGQTHGVDFACTIRHKDVAQGKFRSVVLDVKEYCFLRGVHDCEGFRGHGLGGEAGAFKVKETVKDS